MEDKTEPPDSIAELITTYNELNSSVIQELHQEPSPLEFMRHVARNTPFVVRGAARDWEATRTWTAQYLIETLGHEHVNVAVTPKGNADSPTALEDGTIVFAKPCDEQQSFAQFLNYVIRQERDPSFPSDGEVRYAQTQNDNLRDEYVQLLSSVARDIPFARIALDKTPDAVNLWIGNSRSVTALHRDNYENIYVQVRGCKHFVLLPPVCQPCVAETALKPATYSRRETSLELVLDETEGVGGDGEHAEIQATVPFALWDPDHPHENATAYSNLTRPMRVTLEPGDMLYLPAMWYHKVAQSASEDGICVAVNYWYDMEFTGPTYALSTFVRSVYQSHTSGRPI